MDTQDPNVKRLLRAYMDSLDDIMDARIELHEASGEEDYFTHGIYERLARARQNAELNLTNLLEVL